MAQDRKASSLQECVTAPTSPELVARILALSSERLTPAMEATSLMSSSSLSTEEHFKHLDTVQTSTETLLKTVCIISADRTSTVNLLERAPRLLQFVPQGRGQCCSEGLFRDQSPVWPQGNCRTKMKLKFNTASR